MTKALALHLRRHSIAYLALFVALSGVAYAGVIAPRNSVESESIRNGEVKRPDIANGAVSDAKLANEFVPQGDVTKLFMEEQGCTDTPSSACDADLGPAIGGEATIHARCANGAVDGQGGFLTITTTGQQEVDGYRIQSNTAENTGGNSTLLNRAVIDDFGEFGQMHLVYELDGGRTATADLTWSIDTGGEGTAACDIEGVAVASP